MGRDNHSGQISRLGNLQRNIRPLLDMVSNHMVSLLLDTVRDRGRMVSLLLAMGRSSTGEPRQCLDRGMPPNRRPGSHHGAGCGLLLALLEASLSSAVHAVL